MDSVAEACPTRMVQLLLPPLSISLIKIQRRRYIQMPSLSTCTSKVYLGKYVVTEVNMFFKKILLFGDEIARERMRSPRYLLNVNVHSGKFYGEREVGKFNIFGTANGITPT